jgi:anti-sigma factor RsiW
MNSTDLPPLPSLNVPGPGVCDIAQLYLAVWNDLSERQQDRLAAHIEICPDCAAEHRLMRRATRQVAGLATTTPSPHVDQAVLAAIAARRRGGIAASSIRLARSQPRRSARRLVTEIAALAAIFMLALLGISQLLMQTLGGGSAQSAFALPSTVSWNGYVLYHTQTEKATNGKQMVVTTYLDLGNGNQHVETTMDNELDVVVVTDKKEALGMDMMHNVAQWDAQAWTQDESLFNLTTLRQGLASHKVTYIGMSTYNGQSVYQLRNNADGTILLLNKSYVPVNVLEKSTTPTAGKSMQPMYDTFLVLPASRVPADTWDMTVPKDFKMGKLPAVPV